ncbi:MAG: hypothetical protein AMQ74_01914 [Candidatus Methanofastidiosum methylothiophilum]|uniref:Restriction endonuclease n=1 Tax=Candidatus Methanofastidiosum methylothiophilum TaxID=1705564 RepID=A0A150IJI0_9EURY|nr:MAG: hypothetical protein AMQ74_01914 [Candidatus Methanofastidiosum methylthiophilus]
MIEHTFTPVIRRILQKAFGKSAKTIFDRSFLLQYLNIKTKAAERGAKSRASYANLYALYVVIEDYVNNKYHQRNDYKDYEGARFIQLFRRQRQLPFGSKLQNHALNHRLNEEFKKFFPNCEFIPILRNVKTSRYWINENLLILEISGRKLNIAQAILLIIDSYIEVRRDIFKHFIRDCQQLRMIQREDSKAVDIFIRNLLRPNVDARIFEIVSYAILKEFYGGQSIFWGWTLDDVKADCLVLYKTGRTNANDGGIDFVMRPLGRFFQVTETVDAGKYFLDIDKIQKFPLTFVVKSEDSVEEILKHIRIQAERSYKISRIIETYMNCIEEVINIPLLLERFAEVKTKNKLQNVIDNIVVQSKVEFNYEDTEE